MSVDLQIVQHKDCLRCFQSIDERAELCPFCQSSQTVRRDWKPYRALALSLTVALCAFLIWRVYADLRDYRLGLERETNKQQEALALTIQEMEARERSEASALQASLQKNGVELEELLRKVSAQSVEASGFCRHSSILSVCSRIMAASAEDCLALAKKSTTNIF